MRLDFEKWYENNIDNKNAKKLLYESCSCYKVSAYRASFIMAYLGLQTILKDRLLIYIDNNVTRNEEINWVKISKGLKNDNKWDDEVFACINMSLPRNPFLITDDIREQYRYFRRIRNDCAHAKNNIISYPHVETLWLFIQANLGKFVVNGGRDGLLERLKKHYNPAYTIPDKEISPIINDIENSMDEDEIIEFFSDVYDIFEEEIWVNNVFEKDSKGHDFWKGIVEGEFKQLRFKLYDLLGRDTTKELLFIDAFPSRILELINYRNEEWIRNFWYEKFTSMFTWSFSSQWIILETLFRNNIIPEEDKNSILNKIIKSNTLPDNRNVDFLKSTNYFDLLRSYIFGNGSNFTAPNGINYGNRKWSSIKFFIENIGLDIDIVRQLNGVFASVNRGTFYDGLKRLLIKNKSIKLEYCKCLEQIGIEIPECINEYEN